MPEEYFIEFNTEINPGKLEGIRVRLDVVTIEDLEKDLHLDLFNHPLYSSLVEYVKNNPL